MGQNYIFSIYLAPLPKTAGEDATSKWKKLRQSFLDRGHRVLNQYQRGETAKGVPQYAVILPDGENVSHLKRFHSDDWIICYGDSWPVDKLGRKRCFHFNTGGEDGIVELLGVIEKMSKGVVESSLYAQVARDEKHLGQNALTYLKELSAKSFEKVEGELDDELHRFLKFHLFFLELRGASYQQEEVLEFLSLFHRNFSSSPFGFEAFDIKHLSKEEALKKIVSGGKSTLLSIPEDETRFISIGFDNTNEKLAESYFICLLIKEIENFQFQKKRFESIQTVGSIWSQAFQFIPYPVALFAKNSDLILHNSMFSKLEILPKNCLKLRDGETFEKDGKAYRVQRRKLDYGQGLIDYFVFYSPHSEMEKQNVGVVSSQELGIVSSSIAHELNNPIAGILAGLALLELEDELSYDQRESIEQMKEGARRCRDLIHIFLGFSRAVPHDKANEGCVDRVKNAFTQAINLLRFRMIESNIRFDINFEECDKKFDLDVNESVLAMIFYLLLGDVLTSFSHHQLIDEEGPENIISAKYYENAQGIDFTILEDFDVLLSQGHSKLLTHLVDMENLEFNFSHKGFSLRRGSHSRLI